MSYRTDRGFLSASLKTRVRNSSGFRFIISWVSAVSICFTTSVGARAGIGAGEYSAVDASVRFASNSLDVVKAAGMSPVDCQQDPRFVNSSGATLEQVVTEQKANELFKFLAQSDIAFETPETQDCEYRAHRMAKYLEDKGYYSQKVFISGDFHVKNGFVVNNQMNWAFHVATMIRVLQGGKEVQMIIDPSMFTRPVPLNDWIKAMTSDQCKQIPITQDTAPYYPKPVPCEYQVTERFQLSTPDNYRFHKHNPPSQWDPAEVKDTNDTMKAELPEALWRREHHAGVEGTRNMAYRIVASGTCVNSGQLTDSDVRCRPNDSN